MNRRIFTAVAIVLMAAGCRKTPPLPWDDIQSGIPVDYVNAPENKVPGTITQEWREQMFDTVRIPGALDPEGVYYRMPHETVVEIRPGRHQEVQYPGDGVPE